MVLDGVAEADSEEMSSQWSICLVNAVSKTDLPPGLCGLEHAAELEEPFAVAGVADAAADEERAQGRLGQEAEVADAHEAVRKQVQQEATQEFIKRESHFGSAFG